MAAFNLQDHSWILDDPDSMLADLCENLYLESYLIRCLEPRDRALVAVLMLRIKVGVKTHVGALRAYPDHVAFLKHEELTAFVSWVLQSSMGVNLIGMAGSATGTFTKVMLYGRLPSLLAIRGIQLELSTLLVA